MEIINNILMIGMVPALFTDDEKNGIISNVKNNAVVAGYENTK